MKDPAPLKLRLLFWSIGPFAMNFIRVYCHQDHLTISKGHMGKESMQLLLSDECGWHWAQYNLPMVQSFVLFPLCSAKLILKCIPLISPYLSILPYQKKKLIKKILILIHANYLYSHGQPEVGLLEMRTSNKLQRRQKCDTSMIYSYYFIFLCSTPKKGRGVRGNVLTIQYIPI